MKNNLFKITIFICQALILITTTNAQVPLIIGGENASENQFPWIGDIRVSDEHQCGGSLIAPNWVLTAAHCCIDPSDNSSLSAGKFIIRFNSVNTKGALNPNGGIATKVKNVYVHPDFNLMDFNNGYDIALLELENPIETILPVLMPSSSDTAELYTTNKKVFVAGWGIADTAVYSIVDIMKWCETKIYNRSACNDIFNYYTGDDLSDDRFCAGYETGEAPSGAAAGDSGGPLWMEGSDKMVLGIVSGGLNIATMENLPGYYTNVAHYRPWIDSIIFANTDTSILSNDIIVFQKGNTVYIKFGNINNSTVSIFIYNTIGQRMYNVPISNPANTIYPIDCSFLANGIYIIRINDEKEKLNIVKKILK